MRNDEEERCKRNDTVHQDSIFEITKTRIWKKKKKRKEKEDNLDARSRDIELCKLNAWKNAKGKTMNQQHCKR